MNLSEHFTDKELNVAGEDERIVENARYLCQEILEYIRDNFGQPVIITSGHRQADQNAQTGGVKHSEHLYDGGHAAADFVVENTPLRRVFDWIRLESGLPFRQVILEKDKNGLPACIHISTDRDGLDKHEALEGMTHGQGAYVSVDCSGVSA